MNKIVIGREEKGNHPEKDSSFDILSLADQLYQSKSTDPDGPQRGKFYFSENLAPDLLAEGEQALGKILYLYNKSKRENQILNNVVTPELAAETPWDIPELERSNKTVNLIFESAHEDADVTSDLSELFF